MMARPIFFTLSAGAAALAAGAAAAAPAWTYAETRDRLTDTAYVIAAGAPAAKFGADDFQIRFECRGGDDFVFAVKTREPFKRSGSVKVRYRIDNGDDKKVTLRGYSDSRDGGLNHLDAPVLANAFLGGDKVFVRIIGPKKTPLEAEFSLADATGPIVRTAVACGYFLTK